MDKNKTVEAVSRFIPLLLWVLIIFFFSAQPSPYELVIHQLHPAATANTRTTADLTETQPPATVKYKGISSIFPRTDDKQEILGRYLHVAEYAILSLLLARTLVWKEPLNLVLLLAALAISVLFALGDEYHQVFVPGRRFETGDLMLDALGSGIGLLTFIPLARKNKLTDNQPDK
jgi:VanZ family protein